MKGGGGEELTPRPPGWRAPSLKGLPSDPELHRAASSQLSSQLCTLPGRGDYDLVLVQPC